MKNKLVIYVLFSTIILFFLFFYFKINILTDDKLEQKYYWEDIFMNDLIESIDIDFDSAYSTFEKNIHFLDERVSIWKTLYFHEHDWLDVFLPLSYVCEKMSWINKDNLISKKEDIKKIGFLLVLKNPQWEDLYYDDIAEQYNSYLKEFIYGDSTYSDFYKNISSIDIKKLVKSKNENVLTLVNVYFNLFKNINENYSLNTSLNCRDFMKDNYFLSNLYYE